MKIDIKKYYDKLIKMIESDISEADRKRAALDKAESSGRYSDAYLQQTRGEYQGFVNASRELWNQTAKTLKTQHDAEVREAFNPLTAHVSQRIQNVLNSRIPFDADEYTMIIQGCESPYEVRAVKAMAEAAGYTVEGTISYQDYIHSFDSFVDAVGSLDKGGNAELGQLSKVAARDIWFTDLQERAESAGIGGKLRVYRTPTSFDDAGVFIDPDPDPKENDIDTDAFTEGFKKGLGLPEASEDEQRGKAEYLALDAVRQHRSKREAEDHPEDSLSPEMKQTAKALERIWKDQHRPADSDAVNDTE